MKKILNTFGPLIALLLIYGLFTLMAPSSFSTLRNLETIIRQSSIVGVAALGMTLVIILGGIDLSIGSIIAVSTVIIALLLNSGSTIVFAVFLGILFATVFGALNGILITRLKIVPFITTLGTLLIVRGIAKGLANEQKVDAPITWLVNLLASLRGERTWMLLPPGVWLMLALAVIVSIILRYTVLGNHIFAIGSNKEAARLCGIPVKRVTVIVYLLCGAMAGIAGLLQFSRLTVGDPTVAIGLELDVIAAVVIGGGSLSGGQGSVSGSLIGTLIMTVIRSGCSQMGLPNWIQEIVTGAIIVIAVWLDKLRHK